MARKLSTILSPHFNHDRSFLNEVCTDTIEFAKQELNYDEGDYDTYVRVSEDNVKNIMHVYQAYQYTHAHIMEFINEFWASASRTKLGRPPQYL